MTPKEKIQYVRDAIAEIVEISPKGIKYHLDIYTLTEYEDGPFLISRDEQRTIFKKFEQDGDIKNVAFGKDGCSVEFEIGTNNFKNYKTSTNLIIDEDSLEYKSKEIKTIEVLKDKNDMGRIKIYINKNYEVEPLDFSRKGYWEMLAQTAEDNSFSATKECLDYFNSHMNNPLYKTHGFNKTKIFKINNGEVTPNIKISSITRKKISQNRT